MGKMGTHDLKRVRVQAENTSAPFFGVLTVRELLSHIDAVEEEKNRLIDNVAKLQGELVEEREGKKVSLPKEVAEAIGFEREEFYDSGLILNTINRSTVTGKVILNWLTGSWKERFTQLLSALVNGYTVEEPPTAEERIEAKIYEELTFHGIESPIEIKKLAKNLTLAVLEALAEDKQHD